MRLARLGLLLASAVPLAARSPAAAAGCRSTRLIEVSGAGHFTAMAADYFQQAIGFLDAGSRNAGG